MCDCEKYKIVKAENGILIEDELNDFDLSQLDWHEERMYNDFIKHSTKSEALQIIINSVEGDYSQLSPKLAEIAEKQDCEEEFKNGGDVKTPKYDKAIKEGDDDVNRTVIKIIKLPKEKIFNKNKYILVGSEMYTNDADKLAEELIKEGYDAKSVHQNYKYLDKHPSWNKQRRTGIVGAVYRSVEKIMKNGGGVTNYKIGDVVYNKEHNTIGIVRDVFDRNDLRTDSDGVVYMSDLEHYDKFNPIHKSADIAPSTKKELGDEYANGGWVGEEIVRNKNKNDWKSKFDFYLKYNTTPVGKGMMMEMAYGDTKNVDSAIPQSLWGTVDNTSFYVYDYTTNSNGELVDLRVKLKFSNVKVAVTIVKNGDVLYKDKLPSELQDVIFHKALDYVFNNDDVEAFDIRPINSKYENGGGVGYGEIKKEKEKMITELFNKFGVFFAFSNEQFNENKTPLKEGEKYVSIGAGGYIPKGNLDAFLEGMESINKLGKKKVKENNLAETEILYELRNHECFYTGDYSDVVDMFKGTYTEEQIRDVYNKHRESNQDFENGGGIGNQNALMVMNDNKQIKHHTEELNKVVDTNTEVPAWVVSKVHRSASDLSDATHYLDGTNSEFKSGGGIGKKRKYKLGDKYRSDFDYDGMLEMGLKANLSLGYNKLVKLHNSFEDVNYHSASKPLWEAIQNLKNGNNELAEKNIIEFHKKVKEETMFNPDMNDNEMENGGTIDSSRRFTEGDFNKLTYNGFKATWSGYVWEIYPEGGGQVLGKFNPKKNTLFIAGKKDLSNPLVKYLQENSYVSSEEYVKLSKGGGINSGRDLLFKSKEPHEQSYKRKREFKKYGSNGNWFSDLFDNGGGIGDKEKSVQEALEALKNYGANIEKVGDDKYWVEDNGIWGLLNEEEGMSLDGDEIIELSNQYADTNIEYKNGGGVGKIKVGDFVTKKGSNLELKVLEIKKNKNDGKDYITIYNDVTGSTQKVNNISDYELVKYANGGDIDLIEERKSINKPKKLYGNVDSGMIVTGKKYKYLHEPNTYITLLKRDDNSLTFTDDNGDWINISNLEIPNSVYDFKATHNVTMPELLSVTEVEIKIGRKINSWKDNSIQIGKALYEKVYLKPEYKKIFDI